MLDQNTDRMWYVIGAVLLGAAILLLINGVAPDLFAQVTDTYKEKTEEATDAASEIEVYTGYYDRMLEQFTAFLNDPTNWEQGGLSGKGTETENDFVMRTDYLPIDPGTYTLHATTERPYTVVLSMRVYKEQNASPESFVATVNETHDSHTFTVPEEANYTRLRVLYHDPELVSLTNPQGWVKKEWDPSEEVPLMDFKITRRTEKDRDE